MDTLTMDPDVLTRDGYCIVPNVLSPEMLDRLRSATDALIDGLTPERKARTGRQGINIAMTYQDPVFADLIAWPAALATLARFGYADPRYWSGYILSKDGIGDRLYWHQDWPFWDEPISAEPRPSMLFLMYYLVDTSPANGCLRVIPGTHRRRIPFHDSLPEAHTAATFQGDTTSPLFCTHPDEVDVAVRAGDLVIGDARLLHAAHANRTLARRTVLTCWWFPRYADLAEPLRAGIQRTLFSPPPATLDPAELAKIRPHLVDYAGDAPAARWNRVPSAHLRSDG